MRLLSAISVMALLVAMIPKTVFAEAYDPKTSYKNLGIRFWEDKQPDVGFYINASSRYILETVPEPSMGTIAGEWSVMDLLRGKYAGYDYINYIPENYFDDYLIRIEQYVNEKNGNLDRSKSTEWSRLILALSALGYDITDVAGYDFIEKLSKSHKFSYRQGINGPIWEIIAMNTGNYEFYKDIKNPDVNTYGKMIDYILQKEITQKSGMLGGWALFGKNPDPDITAMALQALAPFYLDKERYLQSGATTSYEDFAKAVERAIYVLSLIQTENGAYAAFGNVNAESTVQVIVALTTLGIDPLSEKVELNSIGKNVSFIKNGAIQDGVWTNNMIDALITFWANGSGSSQEVGGFKHVTTGYDGGGGSGTGVNAMATDQALYGLIAYDRFKKGKNTLYDMTDMINGEHLNMLVKTFTVEFVGISEEDVKQEYYAPYQVLQITSGNDVKGKKFKNWNTKKDGSGTVYNPSEKLSMPEQNIALYAQYENIQYTIILEANGADVIGDKIPTSYTIEDNDILLPTAEQMKNEGYIFKGWYDNSNFEGNPIKMIPSGSYGNKTFYAKWIDTVENDKEMALKVEKMIDALPQVDRLTIDNQEEVNKTRVAYDALQVEQQKMVKNIEDLIEREKRMIALIQEKNSENSAKVEKMISDLPEESIVMLQDKIVIEEAREAFEKLTELEQKLVSNIETLIQLENKVKELEQQVIDESVAKDVEKMIRDLPEESSVTLQDKTLVNKVRVAYDLLTESQKKHVLNYENLQLLEVRIASLQLQDDQEKVQKIGTLIDNIPEINLLTIEHKVEVENLRKMYYALTKLQQKLLSKEKVTKFEEINIKMNELEQKSEDEAAAQNIIHMIEGLPDVNDLTMGAKNEITRVRTNYNNLSDSQQKLVKNIEQLIQLEQQLVAKSVEEMIMNLPEEFALTLEQKVQIEKAREAFNNLTEEQKKSLTNQEKLIQLENKLKELEKQEIDKSVANVVEDIIKNLPEEFALKLEQKVQIEKAREAYENLTEEQKKLVSNKNKLITLESKINELEKNTQKNDNGKSTNDERVSTKKSDSLKEIPKANQENIKKKNIEINSAQSTNRKNPNQVKDKNKQDKKKLPKTGESQNGAIRVAGILLLVFGLTFFIRKRDQIRG